MAPSGGPPRKSRECWRHLFGALSAPSGAGLRAPHAGKDRCSRLLVSPPTAAFGADDDRDSTLLQRQGLHPPPLWPASPRRERHQGLPMGLRRTRLRAPPCPCACRPTGGMILGPMADHPAASKASPARSRQCARAIRSSLATFSNRPSTPSGSHVAPSRTPS